MSTTVPRETVEEMAARFRELRQLQRQQQATMAEMIRACVANLDIDVENHGMRGHETGAQRIDQRNKNKANKAQARLYLLTLATSLEDQSGAFDLAGEAVILAKQ